MLIETAAPLEAVAHSARPWIPVDREAFARHAGKGDTCSRSRRGHHGDANARPRIAVCLAGQTRSLVQPALWHSVMDLLLDGGRHDLYMSLSTSGEQSDLRHADASGPDACALQEALSALNPKRLRLTLRQQPVSCNCSATGQFAKWADCVDLVRQAEVEDGVARYEYILKARPDLLWTGPAKLDELVESTRSTLPCGAVISGNDHVLLVPRSRWSVLQAMRPHSLVCNRYCSGERASPLHRFFDEYNEYCLMLFHFAKHRTLHIEAAHPTERGIGHTLVTNATWSQLIRAPNLRIERQPLRLQSARLATVCSRRSGGSIMATQGERNRWRCWYCVNDAYVHAAEAAAPSRCPAEVWDARTDGLTPPSSCTSAREWSPRSRPEILGVQAPGFCEGTPDNTPCEHVASRGFSGSWNTDRYGVKTLADCVGLCRSCALCRYVSLSLENRDCSWYHICDMQHLQGSRKRVEDGGYLSMQVRNATHTSKLGQVST